MGVVVDRVRRKMRGDVEGGVELAVSVMILLYWREVFEKNWKQEKKERNERHNRERLNDVLIRYVAT